MRILNLAVDFDKLDKNRLKRVELPDTQTRERVATIEELKSIKGKADERRLKAMNANQYDPAELWRIVTVALNTGLQEVKVVDLRFHNLRHTFATGFRISVFHSKCERHCLGIAYEEWGTINSEENP